MKLRAGSYILMLCLLKTTQLVFGQCSYIGPENIPPASTRYFGLEVSGATNGDLSDPGQGVCAVLIDFSHPFIGDLIIRLISPDGDIVELTGPSGVSGFTNLTRWNISFLPCADQADPDPGFNPVWNNLQPWGIFGNFQGSYYPHSGCLEDFDSGPVNGTWQLEVINQSPFNTGVLREFSVFFCDPSGLDCFVCLAKGGTIDTDRLEFCEGDDELRMDVNISFVGLRPNPQDYRYMYLLGDASGYLIDSLDIPDLRGRSAGIYQLCGISLLHGEQDSIPAPDGNALISVLRDTLRSNQPPFCGAISSNCLQIVIHELPDTVVLVSAICEGDSVLVGGEVFRRPGTYTTDLLTASGCDSTVVLDLSVFGLTAVPNVPDSVSCENGSVALFLESLVTDFPGDSLHYYWLNVAGDTLSNEGILQPTLPGDYRLVLTGRYGELECTHLFHWHVEQKLLDHIPEISLPVSVCRGSIFGATVSQPAGTGAYTWTVSGAELIEGQGSSSVLIGGIDADLVRICATLEDTCYVPVEVCREVIVSETPTLRMMYDSIVCGLSTAVYIEQSEGMGIFSVVSGPGTIVRSDWNADHFILAVDQPGFYTLLYEESFAACEFTSLLRIRFVDLSDFAVELLADTICAGQLLSAVVHLPETGTYGFEMWIDGQLAGVFAGQADQDTIRLNVAPGAHWLEIPYVSFEGGQGCTEQAMLRIPFYVYPVPVIDDIEPLSVCNADFEGTPPVLDLSGPFADVEGMLSISNPAGIGAGSMPVLDFTGVLPGSYMFPFELDYSRGLCLPVTGAILVTVRDCSCPLLQLSVRDTAICTDARIDLSALLVAAPGDWRVGAAPVGHTLSPVTGPELDFSGQPGGIYELIYTLHEQKDGCRSADTLIVDLAETTDPGDLICPDIRFCAGDEGVLELMDCWSDLHSQARIFPLAEDGLPAASYDPESGRLQKDLLDRGDYRFTLVLEQPVRCLLDADTLFVRVGGAYPLDLGSDILLGCTVRSVDLGEGLPDPAGYIYSWSVLDGGWQFADPAARSQHVGRAGVIALLLTDKVYGCMSWDTLTVDEIDHPIDSVTLTVRGPACPGGRNGSIQIAQIWGGTAPFVFRLNHQPPTTQQQFNNLPPGSYTLLVTDALGCTAEVAAQLTEAQMFGLDIGPDLFIIPGQGVDISWTTGLPQQEWESWYWSVSGRDTCSGCMNLSIAPQITVPVVLTLQSVGGCLYRDTMWIYTDQVPPIFVPTAFSPNADGINDVLEIFVGDTYMEVQDWRIFDRWGNLVYSSGPFIPVREKRTWDGTFYQRPLLPGVYAYLLTYRMTSGDIRTQSGEVLLIR